MSLVTLQILLVVLAVGATSLALAAGGGGSAGGSGAQNAINGGRTMADGQLGPLGAPNHPRVRPSAMTGNADTTPSSAGGASR